MQSLEQTFSSCVGLLIEPLFHQRPDFLEGIDSCSPWPWSNEWLAVRWADLTITSGGRKTRHELPQILILASSVLSPNTDFMNPQVPLRFADAAQ